MAMINFFFGNAIDHVTITPTFEICLIYCWFYKNSRSEHFPIRLYCGRAHFALLPYKHMEKLLTQLNALTSTVPWYVADCGFVYSIVVSLVLVDHDVIVSSVGVSCIWPHLHPELCMIDQLRSLLTQNGNVSSSYYHTSITYDWFRYYICHVLIYYLTDAVVAGVWVLIHSHCWLHVPALDMKLSLSALWLLVEQLFGKKQL